MTVIWRRSIHRIRGAAPPIWLCCALLCGIGISDAKAGFVGYYSPGNFTLTNYGGGEDGAHNPTANGFAIFPDWKTLILTGTNDGSGLPGWTDLVIPAVASGWFQFNYIFNTEDEPGFEYAGYLIAADFAALADPGAFFSLADANDAKGFVRVPVTSGQWLGFRAGSVDSQAFFQGVLTVTDFSAPVPEPGTFYLLAIAGAVLAAGRCHGRFIRKRPY